MPDLIEVAEPGTRIKLRYGNPWQGLNDAEDPSVVDRSQVVDGSEQFYLDNTAKKFIRRRGMANFGGAFGILEAGITNTTYTLRGIDLKEYRADALGPNFSFSLFGLWAEEVDAGDRKGIIAWYDPTNGVWKTVCQTADADFPNNVKTFPFIGGRRMGASAAGATVAGDRARMAQGSRNLLDMNDWVHAPNFGSTAEAANNPLLGVPFRWSKSYPASGAGTSFQKERAHPTGLMPPMWMPRIGFTTVGALPVNETNWQGKDFFYISCFFIRDDGAWGPIVEPRPPSTILAAGGDNDDMSPAAAKPGGYGLIKLSNTATDVSRVITWTGIPVPPKGYSHVGLVRSPKVDGSAALAAAVRPDLSDMRLVAIIPRGQTTYTDSNGNDAELLVDTRIRTDPQSLDKTIWPPRARHMFPFDGRIAVSYVRDNPCAILITPRGSNATNDEFNTDDENFPTPFPKAYIAIVTASADIDPGGGVLPSHTAGNAGQVMLDLIYWDSTGPNVVNRRSYRLSDYTLETLVDRINSGTVGANDIDDATTRRWHAQLVPGVNRGAPATSLISFGKSTGVGSDFDDEATFTPGAGSAPNPPLISAFATMNPQRVFGSGWPGLTLLSQSGRPTFQDFLYFTRGGPSEPSNSPDNWSFRNNRRAPSGAGFMMGGAPLLDGALVACSNKICILRNLKDGKSGADDDYRIEIIDEMRGALGPPVSGPGFAVVWTDQGMFAYDELGNSLCLSDTLFNPGDQTGELSYEIAQSIIARSRDQRLSVGGGSFGTDYFNTAIGNGKIWIAYRTSASSTQPNAFMQLDFSPGIDQRGLKALIDPRTGKPWGWSTRLVNEDSNPGFTAMTLMRGDIAGTTAQKWYAARDVHGGVGVVEGRVDEFDVGIGDNTTDVNGILTLKIDKPGGSRYRVRGIQATVDWRCTTACTLEVSRSGGAFGTAISLGATGANRESEVVPLTVNQRGPASSLQLRFKDPGTALGARAEVWGIELEVEIVDTGAI